MTSVQSKASVRESSRGARVAGTMHDDVWEPRHELRRDGLGSSRSGRVRACAAASAVALVSALISALFVALGARLAAAHVAPAMDTNNRYLRLAPMGDRVRVAYIVYIGEIPGAQARLRMDRDGDGQLADAEAQAYGDEVAQAVADGLEITVDGAAYPMAWSEVSVGLGTPVTRAGSFSVDLIGWLCLPDLAAATHEVVLFDRFRINAPGESELRVQQSPGIEVRRSTFGADGRASTLDMTWRGAGGPTSTMGYYLTFAVSEEARQEAAAMAAADDDACRERAGPKARGDAAGGARSAAGGESGGSRGWALWAAMAAALVALGAVAWWIARRRVASGRRHK
jgi:hypothetical protein